MKIRSKLLLLIIVLSIIPQVSIGFFIIKNTKSISKNVSKTLDKNAKKNFKNTINNIVNFCKFFEINKNKKVDNIVEIIKYNLAEYNDGHFEKDLETSTTIENEIKNIDVILPNLSAGFVTLNNDKELAKNIAGNINGIVSFYIYHNNKFIQISNSADETMEKENLYLGHELNKDIEFDLISKGVLIKEIIFKNKEYFSVIRLLKNDENQITGAINALFEYPMDKKILTSFIQKLNRNEDNHITILNRSGDIIVDKNSIKKNILMDKSHFISPNFNTIISNLDSSDKISEIENNSNKSNKIITYYKYFNPLNWIILVSKSEKKIFKIKNSIISRLAKIGQLIFMRIPIIVFIVFIISFIYINRRIILPINKLIEVLKDISSDHGDLSQKLTLKNTSTSDELYQISFYLNRMREKLMNMIIAIQDSSKYVSDASNNLKSAAERNSIGASNQSASIEEMASAIEEMMTTINHVAENTDKTKQFSDNIVDNVDDGNTIINNAFYAMENIEKEVDISENLISKLGKELNKINDIVDVVIEIAQQTNLLALNATIESARAGEAGKGFAVVADEIRNLAEKTTNETKIITNIIKDINQVSEKAITSIKTTKDVADNGVELNKKMRDTYLNISSQISQISLLINKISSSTAEQKTGTQEIESAIGNVSNIVEEFVIESENTYNSSNNLVAESKKLNDIIGTFKV